jgi:hypothetical protein
MENPASRESYEDVKRKAREFYQTIGHVWCPALKDYVAFNAAGFHHLIWKRKKLRHTKEQMKRFHLMSDATMIVASSIIVTEHRATVAQHKIYHRSKRKTIVSRAHFWSLTGERNGRIVTVVIRQFKDGEKQFFSIFSE